MYRDLSVKAAFKLGNGDTRNVVKLKIHHTEWVVVYELKLICIIMLLCDVEDHRRDLERKVEIKSCIRN